VLERSKVAFGKPASGESRFSGEIAVLDIPLHVIGVTRFSVLTRRTLSSFRKTRDVNFEAAKQVIYHPTRMEQRFALFRHFCLPTYAMFAEQRDRSLGLVIIGETMPGPWKDRLIEMLGGLHFVQIVQIPDDETIHNRVRAAVADLTGGGRTFTYRFDDDDALSSSFVPRVTEAETTEDGTVVSFNNGVCLARQSEQTFRLVPRHYPLNAQGIGIFSRGTSPITAVDLGTHTTADQRFSVLHLEGAPAWIMTAHGANDGPRGTYRVPGMDSATILDCLNDSFPQITSKALLTL
jgi:Putative rhamnosyl transferase